MLGISKRSKWNFKIYKRHKIVIAAIFIVTLIVMSILEYAFQIRFGSDYQGNLIVFLSIIAGFYITALSSFVQTKTAKDLLAEKDEELQIPKLFVMLNYFRVATALVIVEILYILFFFDKEIPVTLKGTTYSIYLALFDFPILFINLWFMWLLIDLYVVLIAKETQLDS